MLASPLRYEVYTRIMSGKLPSMKRFTPEAKNLVRAMLTADFGRRLHALDDVKQHAWFAGLDWAAVAARRLKPPHVPRVLFPGDRSNFDPYEIAERGLGKLPVADNALFRSFG